VENSEVARGGKASASIEKVINNMVIGVLGKCNTQRIAGTMIVLVVAKQMLVRPMRDPS
jgi:hypothetical protein